MIVSIMGGYSLNSTLRPMVSCIMPTRNRPEYVLQAVKYFERQDYPHRELIIIDDGTQDLSLQLLGTARVRYVIVPPNRSIGTKRNIATRLARGSIIAHWDDDDWYASSRLSAQVQPIERGETDICAFHSCTFLDLDQWIFWSCTPAVFDRMSVGGVHSGTLVYRRSLFDEGVRYPNVSRAEDASFLLECHRRGARIDGLPSNGHFIYVRHKNATWAFTCGKHIDQNGWNTVPEPGMPLEDRLFLTSLSRKSSNQRPHRTILGEAYE